MQLSYLGINVEKLDAQWDAILFDVLGLEARPREEGEPLQLRVDDRHHRISLYPTGENGTAYVGWEADTQAEFDQVLRGLREQGVACEEADARLCAERAVMRMVYFEGPDGVRTELAFGGVVDGQPFKPSRATSGFNTGEQGLGHILMASADPAATVQWYQDKLGFKVSDYIHWDEAKATFLHCNPRHHSLAIMNPCFGTGAGELNHLMLQARSIDDVGRGYDEVQRLGIPLALTLGKHTNDHMTSFYMITPAGFAIEYGYGGRTIEDEEEWEVQFYNAPKLWGHNLGKAQD